MPFIDTVKLKKIERRPGWHGCFFDSSNMTFGHYVFRKGADIHAHSHAQEEVWNMIGGKLQITIAGRTRTAGPGGVAIVPPNTEHRVLALSDGKAIVVDHPLRTEFQR
jgi:quercetin dioxygenase-like cupin family protein